MATKGMTEFMSNGTAFTINDPNNAGEFSSSEAYATGKYVYYQGDMYKFIVNHPAGAWNSAHVKRVYIGDELDERTKAVEEVNRAALQLGEDELMPEWENGAYNDTTGAFISTTERVVTKKFKVYKGNSITAVVPSGFQFKVCKWNASGVFIDTGGWLASGVSYYCNQDLIVSIMATNDSTVSPSSFTGKVYIDSRDYRNMVRMNSVNRQWGYIATNTQLNGITIELKNGLLKLAGEAEATTYWDIISDLNALPYGVAPSESYYVSFDSPFAEDKVYLTIYYNYGSGWVKKHDYLTGLNKITVPANAVGMLVRLYVANGTKFTGTQLINFTISEQPSNRDLMKKINSSGSMAEDYMQMRFLEQRNVGDCTVIKYKDGTVMVIDFGYPDPQGQIIESRWESVVSELEISHIDYAIISHYHSDHTGMLIEGTMDSYIDSNTTFFLPQPFTAAQLEGLAAYDVAASDSVCTTYANAIAKIDAKNCIKVYPTENQEFNIGGSIVRFWNTDHTSYLNRIVAGTLLDYNPCSICNYITMGSVRVAFTGDISNEVMEDYKDSVLPSQIFKVNHHCNGYVAVPRFMNSLMPDLAVTMISKSLVAGYVDVSGQQEWFEDNFVPNVITGVNEKTLSLLVSTGGYVWDTSCRKHIIADDEE